MTGDATLYAQWERVAATISAPSQAAPGDTITVTGENFIPGESVELSLHSTPVLLATVVVGADGTFSTDVVIPASTASGAHHIEAVGTDTVTVSTAVTLFAPADEPAAPPADEPSAEATDSELSSTGTNAGDVTWLALALLLGGLALTMPRALRRRG